jgi:hypothetical protein
LIYIVDLIDISSIKVVGLIDISSIKGVGLIYISIDSVGLIDICTYPSNTHTPIPIHPLSPSLPLFCLLVVILVVRLGTHIFKGSKNTVIALLEKCCGTTWKNALASKHDGKYIHTHMHIYIHIHTYIHTYINTYTYTYIHTHIHTYIYTNTYIHTYINTYIHTYIHTHIHTQG